MSELLAPRVLELIRARAVDGWTELEAESAEALAVAQRGNDEVEANRAWFLNSVIIARRQFVGCVKKMRDGRFYDAWCELEQIENLLRWVQKNPVLSVVDFAVAELAALVSNWQSLYPYRVFFSPEFVIRRRECSICSEPIDPWSACKHEVGRVYHGRLCYRTIHDVEMIAVSLVKDPVQKYSVAFACEEGEGKPDYYDYSTVKYALKLVQSSFTKMQARWTEALHPHELFSHVSPNDACPCESGKAYSECCLNEPGVKRPHLSICVDEPVPDNVSKFQLVGYGRRDPAASE